MNVLCNETTDIQTQEEMVLNITQCICRKSTNKLAKL